MTNDAYRFSSSTAEMDRERILGWLSDEAYWARGRARAVQDAAIDASMNFGMFHIDSGAQVAYARVVTDSATFGWLCDVFVDRAHRGLGLGVDLVAGVCAVLDELGLKRTILATTDAHGLYAKFGFEPFAEPAKWMARLVPTAAS